MSNLKIDIKEIDGGIFLSSDTPGVCLKRWYKDKIQMIEPTINFFEFCKELSKGLNFMNDVVIPRVYEKKSDFLMMDFDASAISIKEKNPTNNNQNILNKLLIECDKINSANSNYLKAMIKNKSAFIRESFETGKLVIAGLETYEETSHNNSCTAIAGEVKPEKPVTKNSIWSKFRNMWS